MGPPLNGMSGYGGSAKCTQRWTETQPTIERDVYLQPYSVTGVEYKRRDLKWTKQQKPFSFQFEAIANSCTITKAHILHLWKCLLARTRNTPTIAHSAGAVVRCRRCCCSLAWLWMAAGCVGTSNETTIHIACTRARALQHAPTHAHTCMVFCKSRAFIFMYKKKSASAVFRGARSVCVVSIRSSF